MAGKRTGYARTAPPRESAERSPSKPDGAPPGSCALVDSEIVLLDMAQTSTAATSAGAIPMLPDRPAVMSSMT